MTAKRLVLIGLTVFVCLFMGLELFSSLTHPQVRSQLELYQTDLSLQAAAWQGDIDDPVTTDSALRTLIGNQPLENALKQYQGVEQSIQTQLANLQVQQDKIRAAEQTQGKSKQTIQRAESLARQQGKLERQSRNLKIRLGLLTAVAQSPTEGIKIWQSLPTLDPKTEANAAAADSLVGLWSDPPKLLPDAEEIFKRDLSGWFQFQSLRQLYQLQQRQDAIDNLFIQEQASAEAAVFKLTLIAGLPSLGAIIGVGILLFWFALEAIRYYRQPSAATNGTVDLEKRSARIEKLRWPTPNPVPWEKETIWQVMVVWFTAFFCLSLILGGLRTDKSAFYQALLALFNYSVLMAAGFTILYLSLKPFLSKPWQWLALRWRKRWFWWGIGGYFAVLPLVIIVSLLSQKLLQDKGGSNPILELILSNNNQFTVLILFGMVAILAPVFEEIMFRGFLLTSLTKFLPRWGAIALSGGMFALAHLTAGDLLPLGILGIALGYIYLRSGNLLSSIFLHSLWNSGSFLALLVLANKN
jgi:membrane protease YdiL (CAAX protease family)